MSKCSKNMSEKYCSMNQKIKTLAFLDCFPLKTQISVSRNKTCRELCTQAHLKLPVFCNSISAFLEDGNWSSFYFLPQLSMFLDDSLCIIVKPHKVNPDQDVLPTYVQVPAASRKTLTFYIPNCLTSQALWWDLQENTGVHFYVQALNLHEILQARTVMKFSIPMPSGRVSEKQKCSLKMVGGMIPSSSFLHLQITS